MIEGEEWNPGEEESFQRLVQAIEAGEIRMHIPCAEARSAWFAMVKRTYVVGDREPEFPIDFETAIHIGECLTPECQTLYTNYQVLSFCSEPEDAAGLSLALDDLERALSISNN